MGEVERIARNLSARLKIAVSGDPLNVKARGYGIKALLDQSLAEYVRVSSDRNRLSLTPLGCDVRDYLLRNPDA